MLTDKDRVKLAASLTQSLATKDDIRGLKADIKQLKSKVDEVDAKVTQVLKYADDKYPSNLFHFRFV